MFRKKKDTFIVGRDFQGRFCAIRARNVFMFYEEASRSEEKGEIELAVASNVDDDGMPAICYFDCTPEEFLKALEEAASTNQLQVKVGR